MNLGKAIDYGRRTHRDVFRELQANCDPKHVTHKIERTIKNPNRQLPLQAPPIRFTPRVPAGEVEVVLCHGQQVPAALIAAAVAFAQAQE
jgi:hypothetical protein